jgi:hypothetical protein
MAELIADARHSVTVPSNSSMAVMQAVRDMNVRRVLVRGVFCPNPSYPGNSTWLFCPLYSREDQMLDGMDYSEWLVQVAENHEIPTPEIAHELLAVPNLDELWIEFSVKSSLYQLAIQQLVSDSNGDERVVLVSDTPFMDADSPFRLADPTGHRDFLLCRGTLGDRLRNAFKYKRMVTLQPNGYAFYRTTPVL